MNTELVSLLLTLLLQEIDSELEEMRRCRQARVRRQRLYLWLLIQQKSQEKDNTNRHTLRYQSLSDIERLLKRRETPRPALAPVKVSAWSYILNSSNDQAMMNTTGFTFAGFRQLNALFQPLYVKYSPYSYNEIGVLIPVTEKENRGRPRLMKAEDCLGMTLAWYRTRSRYNGLGPFFGMVASNCNLWIRFGRRILFTVLRDHPLAKPTVPSRHKLFEYRDAICNQHNALVDCALTIDGLKTRIQRCSSYSVQEQFYNGWKCTHYVNSLFVFAPDGTIVMCVVNCVGTKHDSDMAMLGSPSIYEQLESIYQETGLRCVADSAFGGASYDSILKVVPKQRLDVCAETEQESEYMWQALKMRQAAEWGMGALSGTWPQLTVPIHWEWKGERSFILWVVVFLHNFRANVVGYNQIRTVYWDTLHKEAFETIE